MQEGWQCINVNYRGELSGRITSLHRAGFVSTSLESIPMRIIRTFKSGAVEEVTKFSQVGTPYYQSAGISIQRYGRFWGVYYAGNLLAVVVYRKGAEAIRALVEMLERTQAPLG